MNRYDSYKDSGVEWIGEIPSGWEITKMKYVGDYLNGFPFKPSDWSDTGRLIIRIQNLTKGNGVENFFNGEIDNRYIVKKGDYLFSWSTTLGLFEWEREDGVLNQHIFKVDLNHTFIKKFYYWVIQGVIRELYEESHGSTMTHLTKDVFGGVRLPLPPLNEQNQIVEYLDEKTTQIDSLIQSKEKKITLLKEKRTSLINQVVTKGLNPNVEMKDSGVEWIGEIPSGWVISKLKHITQIFGRIGFRGYTTEDIVDEGEGVITISPSNIKNDVFSIENSTFLSWNKYYESPEIQIFPNDIIIVKTGSTIGKTSIIPFGTPEMTINPQLIVLKEIQVNNQYLYYQTVCRFIKESFDLEQTGSSTPTISQEKIKEFPVLIPPLSEQKQIVEYLDRETKLIDETISSEEKKIELLKEYKQSLISEVVTGKRKVVN